MTFTQFDVRTIFELYTSQIGQYFELCIVNLPGELYTIFDRTMVFRSNYGVELYSSLTMIFSQKLVKLSKMQLNYQKCSGTMKVQLNYENCLDVKNVKFNYNRKFSYRSLTMIVVLILSKLQLNCENDFDVKRVKLNYSEYIYSNRKFSSL